METAESILTNQEVDAFLEDSTEHSSTNSNSSVKVVNFNSVGQNIAIYPELYSLLDLLKDELCKQFNTFIDKNLLTEEAETTQTLLDDYYQQMDQKAIFSLIYLKEVHSYIFFAFSNELLDPMINHIFGGKLNANASKNTALGNMGVQLSRHLTSLVMQSMTNSIKDEVNFAHRVDRITPKCNVLKARLPNERKIVLNSFEVAFLDTKANIQIGLTNTFIENVKPYLKINTVEKKQLTQHEVWQQQLREEVYEAKVNLVVNFPSFELAFKDIINLKKGDIIPIKNPEVVDVYANDVKISKGVVGENNASYSVKILENYRH